MKTKLRLTTLESRENPSADPATEMIGSLTPPAGPVETTMPAYGEASADVTLFTAPPVFLPIRPSTEPGPAGDRARELDFMLQQILEDMRRVGPPDTFVGPPLPPSLLEGPPERVRPRFDIPLLLPGDYSRQPLPWDATHPDFPPTPSTPPVMGPPLPPSMTLPIPPR